MMKQRIQLFSIALVMLLVAFVSCGDNRIAKDPSLIADEANFYLPDYTVVDKSDNMERSASAWSSYSWKLKLNNPLSEKKIEELNKLVKTDTNWSYDSSKHIYKYVFEEEGSKSISIEIIVDSGLINMEYSWWDMLS